MPSPPSQLHHRLLNKSELRLALARTTLGGSQLLAQTLTVITETASTNDDLVALARDGAVEGSALVAERQTSGKGRYDRAWISPPSSGLTFSMLLRPEVPMPRWGWLPLLAGVAVTHALAERCGVSPVLKWPNDVLLAAPPRKVAGILAVVVPVPRPALVLGIGLNVNAEPDQLPGPEATSLSMELRAPVDRAGLLVAILRELAARYERWRDNDGDADSAGLRHEYRRYSHTLGTHVTLKLPDGSDIAGQALDVDVTGRLVVATETGLVQVAAGDVLNVR
ncbi:MAG: biotin--[acetyl-CoA-carboxylase] ligase [Mycobacteriales bacterium]